MILHQLRPTAIIAAQTPIIGRTYEDPTYYVPDAVGMMEVLAECGKHFTHQSQADLLAGIAAACNRCHRPKPTEQACKTCHVVKPMYDFESIGRGRSRRHCRPCMKVVRAQ